MTNLEFTAYKVYLESVYSDSIQIISKQIKIGKTINVSMEDLIISSFLIEMILNYNLNLSTEEDFNHLSVDEMKTINFYINGIFNTLYNPDFILTE